MAVLADEIQQDFADSPRISVILSPRATLTAQDTLDTLRIIEESFRGSSELKLINASGKEDLGGGAQVGITYQLQDNQLQFEDRTAIAESGTVTSAASSAIGSGVLQRYSLIDTAADFVAANVARGSWVINWTDRSIASVIRVVSPTELETRVLTNGTLNTWSLNDEYEVHNVEAVTLTGGNSTAVDTGASSINSVVPSIGTFVILEKSSSPTLINADVAAFWDALVANHNTDGTFGNFVQKKLLTVKKFLGLK